MNAPESKGIVVGDVIGGKYRVDRKIGQGGMGVVVAATHLELGEQRAIKLLLPEMLNHQQGAELRERFLREGRANVKLKSRHVATVHDVGRTDAGEPFIVMELLDGHDLSEEIELGASIGVPRTVRFVLQALEALAEAHAQGIVHRDIKPANLFITKDEDGEDAIKVLDFGISKITEGAGAEMTKTASVLGTPHYMSPEQMRSTKDVDPRADIWSIGIIMYKTLTGAVPFEGETITALCSSVLQDEPRPPRSYEPDVPPVLEAVLLRCLEKDRDRRYQSVAELGAALLPFATSEQGPASVKRICRHLGVDFEAVRAGALDSDAQPTLRRDSDVSQSTGVPVLPQTVRLDPRLDPSAPTPKTITSVGTDILPAKAGVSLPVVLAAMMFVGVVTTGLFVTFGAGTTTLSGPGTVKPHAGAASERAAPTTHETAPTMTISATPSLKASASAAPSASTMKAETPPPRRRPRRPRATPVAPQSPLPQPPTDAFGRGRQ